VDALPREILSGVMGGIGSTSRQTVQTAFNDFMGQNYETAGTGFHGYTNVSFPSGYVPVDSSIKEVKYYDDYSQIDTTGYGFKSAYSFHALGLSKGLMTGQLTRNLKTGTWQKTIMYYDYRGKLIQDFHLSNKGNIIRKDHQYRFNGELLKTRITKNGKTKTFTYEYNHIGNKVKFKHGIDGVEKTIANYSYDDINRLLQKSFSPSNPTGSKQTGLWLDNTTWLSGTYPTLNDKVTINTWHTVTIPSGQKVSAGMLTDNGILKNFGTLNMGNVKASTSSNLYSLNFKYHIRSGLKGINTDALGNLTNNLFSYRLDYEEGTGGFFDGNIKKQSWKSNIDGKERSFTFDYDGASRLKSGAYSSTQTGENYSLNNVTYDGNGNIMALSRNGATNNNFTSFGNVDNMAYIYQSNSNKLAKIKDSTTTNADLGDFRDGINVDDDYDYWLDGSLKKDKNKKISSITYNYLKLPEKITFDNGRTITTEYDANGTKLKKIDSNGETTDYEEDDIYVNNVLYQTSHDEGRINAQGQYEYNITDHLGNLRVSFRDSLGIAVPVQSLFYDPWGLSMKGMQISRNTVNFNKFQYNSKEIDLATGFTDFGARLYSAPEGRFFATDPLTELSRRFSPFAFSNDNPLRYTDLDGMMASEVGADGLTTEQWVSAHGNADEEQEARDANKEKDKNKKKEEANKKKLPTIPQYRKGNGLNPNGDGISVDYTLDGAYIGGEILKPVFGWVANYFGFGAKVAFSATEKAIIAEARLILKNENLIMRTFESGIGTELKLAGRTVIIEPQAPMSGMTLFEENAFVIGREAFSSRPELVKTILHELYRLQTSTLRGATGIQQAVSQETASAASFAEKAFSQIK
jgi:RHS repeat-associated protein